MINPESLKMARAQWHWRGQERPPFANKPDKGQVSVWDFPRPPELIRDTREIEISASFAAADAESAMRCIIRAFAVSEAREHLDSAWVDHRDEAIASATRGLDVMSGSKGWQTMSLKIQVPRAARSLVLFFGVRTPDKTLPKSAHYIDDVQVSLIEPQPLT
jgi:hypothetical protein